MRTTRTTPTTSSDGGADPDDQGTTPIVTTPTAPPPTLPPCDVAPGQGWTTIRFENLSSRMITVYWVDYDCNETHYADLEPGGFYDQNTSVGHRWRVRDTESGGLLHEFVATPAEPNLEQFCDFMAECTRSP